MQPNDSAFPLGEDQARGLTKREYFAAQALVGYLTLFSGHDDDLPREGLAACWATPPASGSRSRWRAWPRTWKRLAPCSGIA
jgi:hypothetical protein